MKRKAKPDAKPPKLKKSLKNYIRSGCVLHKVKKHRSQVNVPTEILVCEVTHRNLVYLPLKSIPSRHNNYSSMPSMHLKPIYDDQDKLCFLGVGSDTYADATFVYYLGFDAWRDDIRIDSNVYYKMSVGKRIVCNVVNVDGGTLTLQPYGSVQQINASKHSILVSWIADGSFGKLLKPVHISRSDRVNNLLFARVENKNGASPYFEATGMVVEIDEEYDLYLVEWFQRPRHDWVWYNKRTFAEDIIISQVLRDNIYGNLKYEKIGSIELPLAEFNHAFDTNPTFSTSNWDNMIANGDKQMILYDLQLFYKYLPISNIKKHRAVQSAFYLMTNNAIDPGAFTHKKIQWFYGDQSEIKHKCILQQRLDIILENNISSPYETMDDLLTSFMSNTSPLSFYHYLQGREYDNYCKKKRLFYVDIGSVNGSTVSFDIYFSGMNSWTEYCGQNALHHLNMYHVGNIMECLTQQPVNCMPWIDTRDSITLLPNTLTETPDTRWTKGNMVSVDPTLPLYDYQRIIVQEMIHREMFKPNLLSHCIESKHLSNKYNLLTGMHSYSTPFATGGILSLGVGLGKTLCVLATYKMNPCKTLVVVPLTIIDQWAREIKKYLPDVLVSECHGKKKDTTGDIVLTTYGIVRNAYSSMSTQFYSDWGRIVFDESHTIKSKKSVVCKACTFIKANNRWCLSATPVSNNSFKSLESQLSMLQVRPFCDSREYLNLFMGMDSVITRRKHILKKLWYDIVIYQDKKDLIANGMECKDHHEYEKSIYLDVESGSAQDILYGELFDICLSRINKMMVESSGTMTNYLQVMKIVNTLCICNTSPRCVPIHEFSTPYAPAGGNTQTIKQVVDGLDNSNYSQSVKQTVENLADASCVICMEPFTEPTITPCHHVYCKKCIETSLISKRRCPMCRAPVTKESLIEISCVEQADDLDDDTKVFTDTLGRRRIISKKIWDLYHGFDGLSVKMNAVLQTIQENSSSGIVIFSRHNTILKKLSSLMTEESVIILGTSTRKQRRDAIDKFQAKKVKVFLLSTKCAAVGITLTAGSKMIFMEPLLEKETKQQAIGRIARIGQENSIDIINLKQTGFDMKMLKCGRKYEKTKTNLCKEFSGTTLKKRIKRLKILSTLQIFGV